MKKSSKKMKKEPLKPTIMDTWLSSAAQQSHNNTGFTPPPIPSTPAPFTFGSQTDSPLAQSQSFDSAPPVSATPIMNRLTFEKRVMESAGLSDRPSIIPLSGKIEDLQGAPNRDYDAMIKSASEYVQFMAQNKSWNKGQAQKKLYPLELGVYQSFAQTMASLDREAELPPKRKKRYIARPSPYGDRTGGGVQSISSINPGAPLTSGYEPQDQQTFSQLNELYGGTFVRAHEHNKRLGGGGDGDQVTYMTFSENTRMDHEYEQPIKRLVLEDAVPVLWEATPVFNPGAVQQLGYDPVASQVLPTEMSFFAGAMQQEQDGQWVEGNNIFRSDGSYDNDTMKLQIPPAQSTVRSTSHKRKAEQLSSVATTPSITSMFSGASPQSMQQSKAIRERAKKGVADYQRKKSKKSPATQKRIKQAMAFGATRAEATRIANSVLNRRDANTRWQGYIDRLNRTNNS